MKLSFKTTTLIAAVGIIVYAFASCTKGDIAKEHVSLLDNVSVNFKYDTIVDNYEVNGILFPSCKEDTKNNECGVLMFLRNVVTGKEYKLFDYDRHSNMFRTSILSANVNDIINDSAFNGFKNGDSYVFVYHNEHDTMHWVGYDEPEIFQLKSHAEFQFYDIDFDGENELLISRYNDAPREPTFFDAYELTRWGLVKRDLKINSLTRFDKKRNKIFTMFHNDQNQLVMYEYEVSGKGKIHLVHHTLDNYNSGVR